MIYPLFHKKDQKEVKAKLAQIDSMDDIDADKLIHAGHDKAFESIDCLECANCCKTSSPILEQADLDRMAKHLKMSVGQFIVSYAEMDEDGDFVFQEQPCPFLKDDNKCQIYEFRPEACSDYPHTKRKNQKKYLDILEENSFICPAVTHILKAL